MFLSPSNLKLFTYMAVVLSLGVFAIYQIEQLKLFDLNTIRKMFHFLAFILFFPGMIANVSLSCVD